MGYKGKLLEDFISDKSNFAPLTEHELLVRGLGFSERNPIPVNDPAFIYAIDKKANIWVAKLYSVRHSYLVNAENVYGAGEMSINPEAVITRVNGWTGHYLPRMGAYQEAFFPYLKNLLTTKGISFNEGGFMLHGR